MKFYAVVFIDNDTKEEAIKQIFNTKKEALGYCKSFGCYINGRYINALGEYVIIEMGR
jgi:hypothetical protein